MEVNESSTFLASPLLSKFQNSPQSLTSHFIRGPPPTLQIPVSTITLMCCLAQSSQTHPQTSKQTCLSTPCSPNKLPVLPDEHHSTPSSQQSVLPDHCKVPTVSALQSLTFSTDRYCSHFPSCKCWPTLPLPFSHCLQSCERRSRQYISSCGKMYMV